MENRALGEAKWILAAIGAGWLLTVFVFPLLSIVFALALLFALYFFRDPERVPPPGENVAVSPADGLVTAVDEVEEGEFLKTRLLRIGIFLSVLDVHVNRARSREKSFTPSRNPDATWMPGTRFHPS